MPELIKMKTGTISDLESQTGGQPNVSLDKGTIYFAVDTTKHIGKIVYDAPKGTNGVDRIVMSTQAEYADLAGGLAAGTPDKILLDSVEMNANNYSHPTTTAVTPAAVKIGNDEYGHVVLGNTLVASDVGAAASSHAHGNLTSDGKIGTNTAANKAVYTTTNGALTAGTLPVAAGGTGLATASNKNAVVIGNSSTVTNALQTVRTGNGAFYATAQDGKPQFGTLPVAQGGTGQTSIANIQAGKDGDGNTISSTYLKLAGGTMTGVLTLSGDPTANLHAATKQYVDQSFAANDAMIFKGTLGTGGTITSLPNTHGVGWTYKVIKAGTYAGIACEVGDLIICITDGTAANNAHWTVVQTNLDGAVIGPVSAIDKQIAIFNGTTGKSIQGGAIADHSYTPAGTITLTNENTTAAVVPATSGNITYTPAGTVSQSTFTGNSLTSTGKFTPAGTITRSTDVAVNTTTVNSITAVGSLPSLTITSTSVVTGGTTSAIPNISKKTVVTEVTKKTVVTNATFNNVVTNASVTNEILTISFGVAGSAATGDSVTVTTGDSVTVGTAINAYTSLTTSSIGSASNWSAGTLPTKGSNTTVATGIKTQPAFGFTGTEGNLSVSGTPSGIISQPTFTGTGVRLVTENISRPTSASFAGTQTTLSHTIS